MLASKPGNLQIAISPSKTKEGLVGSFVLCLLSAWLMYLISHYLTKMIYMPLPFYDYTVLGLILAFLAVLSDMIESWFKRCADVKDSGDKFPGHGGFFDRIDSSLLALPFCYWYS
jgi:phosphatidate cytidylyltransferase